MMINKNDNVHEGLEKLSGKRDLLKEIIPAGKRLLKGYRKSQKKMRKLGLPEELVSMRRYHSRPIKSGIALAKEVSHQRTSPWRAQQVAETHAPLQKSIKKSIKRMKKAYNK